ncbi:MAG: LLM class flavin-dependent oxidoreductase [Actinomycetota bacterium]
MPDKQDRSADEVRFGAFLSTGRFGAMNETDIYDQTVAMADAAVVAGFDAIWTNEHHFNPTVVCPNAITLAGHLAGRTGLPVGTAVTLLPHHNPIRVAEEAAMLDHLTGGRFTLGIGRGGPGIDYEVFADGLAHYERGIDEALELVRASWSGEVSSDTDLYRFQTVNPIPKPRTAGGPPLTIATISEDAVERAARFGVSMLMFSDMSPETIATMIDLHAERTEALGGPAGPYDHAAAVVVQVADSDDEAAALIREPMQAFQLEASRGFTTMPGVERRRRYDEKSVAAGTERLLATNPVGSPDTVAERLTSFVETSGCRSLLLIVEYTPELDQRLDNITRLGAEVFPRVRAAVGSREPASAG